ncbi:serine hydrolase domain-containing protein [Hyphobacterium sp.]|uniref:serine hydrolase domain-containing protein n=1 Tax=Hyphobacterium sp. TaxID=2004662 RepID=UPI003BAD2B14
MKNILAAGLASIAMMPSAMAQDIETATSRMNAYLDQFSDLVGPGFAVVVVTQDDVLMNRVEGLRRASTGAPLTAETPIYIASQTKAYMGLVAAALDERGILPLDTQLNAYWPDLTWPEGVDGSANKLRDLLTHEVPFSNGAITFLEAYVMRVEPEDYPALIEAHSEPREPGFQYGNIGYNVYGAILETVTGRTWQDWLDEILFDPLEMDQTSARTSDFPLEDHAWSHIWQGEELGWHEVRPKTDGMMQSAGGLVTSPDDMITWLQLQLRGEAPEAGLTASMLTIAQTAYADTNQLDGRNAYEMPCHDYSLGWNICEFQGYEIHIHGGGYTGARTMMAYSPDAGVGIAAFGNSDNMTGWWTQTAVRMFFQFLADDENADRMMAHREHFYRERTAALLDRRQQQIAERNAQDYWEGWAWSPSADELLVYAGDYRPEGLDAPVEVSVEDGGLLFRMGGYHSRLRPARLDLFGGQNHPFDAADRFDFQRNEAGEVVSFTWNNQTFSRMD